MDYKFKYLKYKIKYINLKGGNLNEYTSNLDEIIDVSLVDKTCKQDKTKKKLIFCANSEKISELSADLENKDFEKDKLLENKICRKHLKKQNLSVCTNRVIALLGDSTIDNIIWVHNPTDSVVGRLKYNLLNNIVRGGFFENDVKTPIPNTIYNLAIDGFESKDLLWEGPIQYSFDKRITHQDVDPIIGDYSRSSYNPLKVLEKLNKTEKSPTHIVISIGGNDFRVNPTKNQEEQMGIIVKFFQNYYNILKKIKEINPHAKIILMTQYIIDKDADIISNMGGIDIVKRIMTIIYNILINYLAKPFKCSIIDLSNSFNYNNTFLYGPEGAASMIEPSKYGSIIIAHLIKKACVSNYDDLKLFSIDPSYTEQQLEQYDENLETLDYMTTIREKQLSSFYLETRKYTEDEIQTYFNSTKLKEDVEIYFTKDDMYNSLKWKVTVVRKTGWSFVKYE